jgi:transcriptional regulator with XRE-family HTH domain
MIDMPKIKSRIIAEREATTELMRRLPSLMQNAGISRVELMDRTGINQQAIYALYAGDYKSSLSCDALLAIADALGVSLYDLVGR